VEYSILVQMIEFYLLILCTPLLNAMFSNEIVACRWRHRLIMFQELWKII